MSAECETGIIGSALVAPERVLPLAVEAGVAADWFTEKKWASLWAVMRRMMAASGAEGMDAVTVAAEWRRIGALDERERRAAGVTEPVDVGAMQAAMDGTPTAAHVEHYIALAREARTVRLAKAAARDFVASLEGGAATAIAGFQQRLVAIADGASGAGDVSAGDLTREIVDDFREAHRIRIVEGNLDYVPGLPMPWKSMTLVYQGLVPGLHLIGARPSVGKTLQVLNLMRFWLDSGRSVGFVCLDMESKQCVMRCVSEKARVSLAKAVFGTTTEAQLGRLEAAAGALGGWRLRITDNRDIRAVAAWAMTKRMKGELDVLVVDFVQLLTFEGAWRMGVDDRTAVITGELKRIAHKLHVPVVALSQFNRNFPKEAGQRKEPRLDDFRGGGSLEQDAMTAAVLYTDDETRENWKLCPPTVYAPKSMGQTGRVHMAGSIKPVWFSIIKQQNGKLERWPMVYFQNVFLAMMGDRLAEPVVTGEGKSRKVDNTPLFMRVMPDWRGDRMEKIWAENGALVTEYSDSVEPV